MKEAPLPLDEHQRLEELRQYDVLDTAAEADIDDLTFLAAHICHAPIALVSLVDATRQWFKSKVGIDVTETSRTIAFCAHAILGKDVFTVPDALADDRFADNPLVTGEPRVRFYAGAPLVTSNGYPLGTLCVIDRQARTFLPEEKEALQVLSRQVVQRLEHRRQLKELRRATIERQQAQQAVVESHKQLREFLDTSNELIQRVGLDGRLLYANGAWHKTLGYTRDEAIRLSVFDIIHPDSLDHCRALFHRLMAGESIPRMEFSFVAKDGRHIDVVGSTTFEMDSDNRPIAIHGVFHDVTERKAAEDQVRCSEAFLNSVLDHLPSMVFVKEAKSLRFVRVNKAGEDLLGYSREDLLGKTDYDFFTKSQADFFVAKDREVLASHRLLDIPSETIRTKDKGERFLHTKKIPLYNASGEPEYLLGISEDVTDRKRAEVQLATSEKRLRTILETEPECVKIVTEDCVLLDMNPTGLSFVEADSLEQVRGQSILPIVAPADRERFADFHRRVFNGESGTMQFEIIGLKGTRRWMDTMAVPLKDDSGDTTGVLAITRDHTKQKWAEEALRASEQRYRTLFESSQDAIMTVSPPTWRFTSGNRATVRMFRTKDETEFVTLGPWELSPEQQPDGRLSSDKALEMIETAMREGSHFFEWTHRRRTGETFPATVLLTRMEIDGQPQLQATVRDISDQKQAEETLQTMNAELEQTYRQLNFHLQNTPLGVIQWAPDFQLLHWSAQAERIFGWPAEEVEGKYPHEWPFIPEEEREAMQESMERLRSGQERRKVHRVRHCGKNGQQMHCVWHTSVMVDELGRVVSMMALVQDLSEQVRLEQQFHQAQKMEAIGRLAGGVAHDFNNILTVITGYSHLLLANPMTSENVKQVIEQILHAGDRATGLTRQLLAFSRQQILCPRTLSLNETVMETQKMLRRLIGEDVRLALGLNAHPDTIKADPGQIEQVVMNLAINARDAMPNGGRLSIGTATVRLEEPLITQVGGMLAPGTYVSLAVRDTGSGIDEVTLPKIFDPFFTTKGPGKGTGLGLATVHGIVQQSGGAITVSSLVGEGTTFHIYLPCVAEVESIMNPSSQAAVIKSEPETVLLVEDEPFAQAVIRAALSDFGYTVLEARTAEEAISLSNGYEHPIQLLVTDVVLPLGRGTKLAQDLQEKRPDIKIILMSGYIEHGRTADTTRTRQLPFLQKPFTSEVLLAKVREVLDS